MAIIDNCKVTLGKYKGLTAKKADVFVTEEEVRAFYDRERKNLADKVEVTDRGVQEGDIVVIDYIGLYRGATFEGSRGKDEVLEIGEDLFVPGLDERLIAAETGDKLNINITFPQGYKKMPGLAGKEVTYKCDIKSIAELHYPEYDDVKDELRERILAEKSEEADSELEDALLAAVVEGSEFELDKDELDAECENLFQQWAEKRQAEGFDPIKYLKVYGMDEETEKAELMPEAEERLKTRLVLEAIADEENFEVTEADIDAQIGMIAGQLKMPKEVLKERFDAAAIESVKGDIRMMKAIEVVKSSCALQ
jgi:trigger factor